MKWNFLIICRTIVIALLFFMPGGPVSGNPEKMVAFATFVVR